MPTNADVTLDVRDFASDGGGYNNVTVTETTANCTVPCDPIISNEPH